MSVLECQGCHWYSEPRGGGYYEMMLEPDPACPEHGAPHPIEVIPSERVEQAIRTLTTLGGLLPNIAAQALGPIAAAAAKSGESFETLAEAFARLAGASKVFGLDGHGGRYPKAVRKAIRADRIADRKATRAAYRAAQRTAQHGNPETRHAEKMGEFAPF